MAQTADGVHDLFIHPHLQSCCKMAIVRHTVTETASNADFVQRTVSVSIWLYMAAPEVSVCCCGGQALSELCWLDVAFSTGTQRPSVLQYIHDCAAVSAQIYPSLPTIPTLHEVLFEWVFGFV